MSQAALHQGLHHKRLEQLQGHPPGQAALVQLQLRPDDDDRAAGVVDPLAQEVLAEASLLALEHVREGLQLVIASSGHSAAAAAVVDERVHRLLEHSLLVTNNDLRRSQLQQTLQAVVAVDHAPIEVIEVAGGEATAI